MNSRPLINRQTHLADEAVLVIGAGQKLSEFGSARYEVEWQARVAVGQGVHVIESARYNSCAVPVNLKPVGGIHIATYTGVPRQGVQTRERFRSAAPRRNE